MMEVFWVKKDSYTEITEIVGNISWSGDYTQVARQIEFTLITSPYDKSLPVAAIELGDIIVLRKDNKELFRGYVFFRDKAYNSTTFSYTAYDCGIYLLKNDGSYNFRNTTPEAITKRICCDFGIPYKTIDSTGISINKKFIGVNLYKIIMAAYTIATQNTGRKYMVRAIEGEINIIPKGETSLKLVFENGVNILESSRSESLENMVNKVKIVNKDGDHIKEVTDAAMLNKYGSFQKNLTQAEDKDETSKAKKMLKGIDTKINITGFGDATCITGMAVEVYDSYTGLNGLFYIDSDKHSWRNGEYNVDLTLNLENLMDENEGGQDNDK